VANAWEVDFSRRQVDFNKVTNEDRLPASIKEDQSVSILSGVFDSVEPTQDIVIMNTEKGFVPETVRLKKGNNYRIHVVNVNGKEKNVSFVLDAFSEHHNTVFGEEKTFNVMPKTDGIFSYQCPETAVQGKFIIYSDANSVPGGRKPASN
jgi:plastocyanin